MTVPSQRGPTPSSAPGSLRAAQVFFGLGIALLPFQQAFTITTFATLKFSEIFALAGTILAVFGSPQSRGRMVGRGSIALMAAFTAISAVVAVVRSEPDLTAPGYIISLDDDTLVYAAYALFSLAVATALFRYGELGRMLKAIRISVFIAGSYAAVQLVSWLIGLDLLGWTGGTTQIGTLFGFALPRNGSFLEGNYLGFFAGATLFLSIQMKDRIATLISALLVVYSESTVGLIGVGVALAMLVVGNSRPRSKLAAIGSAGLAIIMAFLFAPTQRFLLAQMAKLGLAENTYGEAIDYSLRARLAAANAGFSMAREQPLTGIGPGRFGYEFHNYVNTSSIPTNYGTGIERFIANNAYVQIAAELGMLALGAFVTLLVVTIIAAKRTSSALLSAISYIAVASFAAPSWTTLVIWIPFGITSASIGEFLTQNVSLSRGKHLMWHAKRQVASDNATLTIEERETLA